MADFSVSGQVSMIDIRWLLEAPGSDGLRDHPEDGKQANREGHGGDRST